MFGSHSQPLILPHQIGAQTLEETHVSASTTSNHIPYDEIDEIPNPDSVYGHGATSGLIPDGSQLIPHRPDGTNQLTISFRGQVYVFDSVGPDKVDAVLSLLGGSSELSCEPQVMELAHHQQNHMPVVEYQNPHRAQSLDRFRKKRNARCFEKKVRYEVRQEVALRMARKKGQFTSMKTMDGADNFGTDQDSTLDDGHSEILCSHCGISSTCTPMMRRGPSGPRTLCNACGLSWANRGTLRDLFKKTEENGGSDGNNSNSAEEYITTTSTAFVNEDKSNLLVYH